jgi:hypothetical protein
MLFIQAALVFCVALAAAFAVAKLFLYAIGE